MGFWVHRLRILFWTLVYHTLGRSVFARVGRGARFEGWVDVPQRGGRIHIGENVRVGRFVEFTVTEGAELVVGNNTFIGRGVVISAHEGVYIGANSMLAEYATVHDNNHVTDSRSAPIRAQGFSSRPVVIGDDCWIGARASLVKGSGMGARCVLGAGAVLTKTLPDGTVAVGVPAAPIR